MMLFQTQKLFQTAAKRLKTFCHSKNLSLLILVLSCLVSANGGQAAEKAKAPYQRKDAAGLYNSPSPSPATQQKPGEIYDPAERKHPAQQNQTNQSQASGSYNFTQPNQGLQQPNASSNSAQSDTTAQENQTNQQYTGGVKKTHDIYPKLIESCKKFGQQVYEKLAPSTLKLCSVFFILLLVWKLCVEGLMQKNMDIQGIGKSLISFCFVSTLLSYPQVFQEYFCKPIQDITIATANAAAGGTWSDKEPSNDDDKGVKELLQQVDNALQAVRTMAIKVEGDRKWYDIMPMFYAAIVILIYFVLAWMFLFYVADMYFGLMVVTALAPLFIAGYLFRVTRGYSEAAIRLAVCSCLTVVLASLCIGLIFNTYVKEIEGMANYVAADLGSFSDISVSLSSIGFLCLLFMRKSAHMAASLCGTSDNGASGLLIGAGMSAAYMAKNVATMGISKVAGAFTGAASAAGGDFKRVPMYTLDNGKNIYSDQDITGV